MSRYYLTTISLIFFWSKYGRNDISERQQNLSKVTHATILLKISSNLFLKFHKRSVENYCMIKF